MDPSLLRVCFYGWRTWRLLPIHKRRWRWSAAGLSMVRSWVILEGSFVVFTCAWKMLSRQSKTTWNIKMDKAGNICKHPVKHLVKQNVSRLNVVVLCLFLAHQFLTTGSEGCGICEEGWKALGLKCYYFSTEKLNWTQSRDYCAKSGSHLVIITSQTERVSVVDILRLHFFSSFQ